MGNPKIVPPVSNVEYIFDTAEGMLSLHHGRSMLTRSLDSKLFQEKVFNKELILEKPINVLKIRSMRDKESDNVVLRFWMTKIDNPTRNNCSMLYYVNDESQRVKGHMEIFRKPQGQNVPNTTPS